MRPQSPAFLTLIAVLPATLGTAARAEQISGFVLRAGDLAPITGAKVTLQATTTHGFSALCFKCLNCCAAGTYANW